MKNSVDPSSWQSPVSPAKATGVSPQKEGKPGDDAPGQSDFSLEDVSRTCDQASRGSAHKKRIRNDAAVPPPSNPCLDLMDVTVRNEGDDKLHEPSPRRPGVLSGQSSPREVATPNAYQRKTGRGRATSEPGSAWYLEEEHEQESDYTVYSPPDDVFTGSCFEDDNPGEPARQNSEEKKRQRQGRQDLRSHIGGTTEDDQELPEAPNKIIGKADRVHYLAMAMASSPPSLRPLKMGQQSSLLPLRPKSRAECERRCGSDGFCDPSNILGCGGEHCGRQYDV